METLGGIEVPPSIGFSDGREGLSGVGVGSDCLKVGLAEPIRRGEEEAGGMGLPGFLEGAVMDLGEINRLVQPLAVSAPVAPVEQPAEHREIIQAVKALNAAEMFGQQNELQFHMDRQSRRIVVQVVNRQTQEVVTQVPPEYLLRLAEDLRAPGP